MPDLWFDLEAFNVRPISVGTFAYAETAEVLMCSYALDDGPARLWDLTKELAMPADLRRALAEENRRIIAHNAMFDRTVARLARNFEPPGALDLRRWRCTMVQACAHTLPASLDQLGAALGLPADMTKLKEGKALIQRFCKPAPKNHKAERYDRHSHPEEWERFSEYALRDIDAMRECAARMPDFNYRRQELELYLLDQAINDRGFRVDEVLVEAGIRAAETEKLFLEKRMRQLTHGEVERPSKRNALKAHLNKTYDLELENTQSATFREVMDSNPGLPDDACEIMNISINSNKTSTAKYKTLKPAISKDGRFRGGLQFDGAARTRRWSGRVFQPHNLPSRGLPPSEDVLMFIEALIAGIHEMLFDELMLFGSASLRGVMIASHGHKIMAADLSNIEGRFNAWLANEQWKLKAFAAFDRGEGEDLYIITACQLTGLSVAEVTKAIRNIFGKVPELALGYQGGVGAFQQFAKVYGVRMRDQWDVLQETLDAQFFIKAEENYEGWGHKSAGDMDLKEWLASEAVKLAWRYRHPKIVQYWHDVENAAKTALLNHGSSVHVGKVTFKAGRIRGHDWLFARLPSGNFLCYFHPRLDDEGKISYMGVDTRQGSKTYGKWVRLGTYGGKLVENMCQSGARDILAHNMIAIEKAGYPIILTVHDEVVCDVPNIDTYSLEELTALLSANPPWAKGLPLAASGFVTQRYKKDD